jgi:catechol 2,3-dioxygenase-like lactoylglutathione lyase family enzyme
VREATPKGKQHVSTQAPSKNPSTFLRTVPVVTVNDLDRSLTFFAQLGFQVQHREGGFAIVTRDEITGHLTHHPEIPPEENNSVCRIVVSNSEALYQEILSIKALHPHLFVRMPSLTTQPWGDKEINLVDPCGILIRLSEPVS